MSSVAYNYRVYGSPPYRLVLVHGGPGAAGSLASLAKTLPDKIGVIEALQTERTIPKLLKELHSIVDLQAGHPVTLIGHSWGAWLSLLFAGEYPGLVEKLILTASGPIEESYVPGIMETRLNRLDEHGKKSLAKLFGLSVLPDSKDKDAIFVEIAGILKKTDAYSPLAADDERVDFNSGIYQSVWAEAEQMRASGELLERAGRVKCPVLAIHGDYDPHPADGVRLPLERKIRDFRFFMLEKCGHEPWNENYAKDCFYEVLINELDIDRDA